MKLCFREMLTDYNIFVREKISGEAVCMCMHAHVYVCMRLWLLSPCCRVVLVFYLGYKHPCLGFLTCHFDSYKGRKQPDNDNDRLLKAW